jgi:Na+-transporting methylmalonyl-CoA/oxaloacetate decarboxylase gamma subunit
MEVFRQTVSITIVGMGLTFSAIGLLVLSMILLTRLARTGEDAGGEIEASAPGPNVDDETAALEQVAAVAVAFALAGRDRTVPPGVGKNWHVSPAGGGPSPWQDYARGRHLEQRRFYHAARRS